MNAFHFHSFVFVLVLVFACWFKTVVLEMAIARLWQESGGTLGNRKVIYISPIKVSRFDRGFGRECFT